MSAAVEARNNVAATNAQVRAMGDQWQIEAKEQNKANFQTAVSQAAQLTQGIVEANASANTQKFSEALEEKKLDGSFNYKGMNKDNGECETWDDYWNNYTTFAENWMESEDTDFTGGFLSKIATKKSLDSYLENSRSSVASSWRTEQWNKKTEVQDNIKKALFNTPFNEDVYSKDIESLLANTKFKEIGVSELSDLANVNDYGISGRLNDYIDQRQIYENSNGESPNAYYESYLNLDLALRAYVGDWGEASFVNYMASDEKQESMRQFNMLNAVQSYSAQLQEEMLEACNSSGGTEDSYTNFYESHKIDNFIKGQNGEFIREDGLTSDELALANSTLNSLLSEAWTTYVTAQTESYNNALEGLNSVWTDGLPFVSSDEYIKALQEQDSSISYDFASGRITDSQKSTFMVNADNEKKRVALEMYVNSETGEDLNSLLKYLDENGLIPTAQKTWGWNSILDKNDDTATPIMSAYKKYAVDEKLSNAEVRMLVFGGASGTTGSSLGSNTSYSNTVFNTEEYYKYEQSIEITKNIDSVSQLAVDALTDGEGKTLDEIYAENGLDPVTYTEFTTIVEEINSDENLRSLIESNPDIGREIIKYSWIMNSPSSTDEDIKAAQNIITAYELQADTRAGNEEFVKLSSKYLTADDEEKAEIEKDSTDKKQLRFLSAISEGDLAEEIKRSAYNEDGTLNKDKLREVLNNWNGVTTSLSSTYTDTTGAEAYTSEKTFKTAKNRESYINAVVKGATGGVKGIKAELENAGFSYDDPMYQSLQDIWETVGEDETLMRAIALDETGEVANTVFNAMYGAKNGDITLDEASAIISEVRLAQDLYDGNKTVLDMFDILFHPDGHTQEEWGQMEKTAIDNGYVYVLSEVLGFGDLTNPNDDDLTNQYRQTYEAMKLEAKNNGVEFDEEKAIMQILSEANVNLEASKDLTAQAKSEHAATYYTGKNTESFSNDAVTLLVNGLSVDAAKSELKKTYPTTWNRKLYDGFFKYLENDKELQAALVGADSDTISEVVTAVTNIINSTSATDAYYQAGVNTLKQLKTKFSNTQANAATSKALAPLFDDNASAEDKKKATEYMHDNSLQNLVLNETVKEYVADYMEQNDASAEEALVSAFEDIDPSKLTGGFSFYNSSSGFQQNATSGNNLYKWSMEKSYNDFIAAEEAEKEQTENEERIASEEPRVRETLLGKLGSSEEYSAEYAESLADYPAYQAIYNALCDTSDMTFDAQMRQGLKIACEDDPNKAKEVYYYTGIYLTGKDSEKTDAEKKLLSISATTTYTDNSQMINLGYIISNEYDKTNNPKGYDDMLASQLMYNSIITQKGITGQEIDENVNSMVQSLRSLGIEVPQSILDEWDKLTYEDYELMSEDEIYNHFSDLVSLVKDAAVLTYNSWNSYYSKATYDGQGDTTVKEVIESSCNATSKKLSDSIMATVYSSGLAKFGESYQGRDPSPDLLKQGNNESNNFRSTAVALFMAESEAEKESILKKAETILTQDSINELKELTPLNLMVRGFQIEGYENYDILAEVKNNLRGSASFNVINTDPTDFVNYMASRNDLLGDLKIALASKNPDTIKNALENYETKVTNGYIFHVNKGESSLTSFTTESFNPVVPDSSSKSADAILAEAESYYDAKEGSRDTIHKSAYSDHYQIEQQVVQLLSGETSSESIISLSAGLTSQDISSRAKVVMSDALALSLMGYDLGLTDKDFTEDTLLVSQQKIYSLLGNHSNDTEWLSNFYGLSNELDKHYELQRDYDSCGYNDPYTMDAAGKITFLDGSTAEKDSSGSWIRTYADGTTINLTLYSNSTPVSEKAQYIFEGDMKSSSANGISATIEYTRGEDGQVFSKLRAYNTQKSSQNNVKDYSKASEIVVELNYVDEYAESPDRARWVDPEYAEKQWVAKETTGTTIANKYANLVFESSYDSEALEKADALLDQLSDGMKTYVQETVDEQLAALAISLHLDNSDGALYYEENSTLMNRLVSLDVQNVKVAWSCNKIITYTNNVDSGHDASKISPNLKKLALDALYRVLPKKAKTSSGNSKKIYSGTGKELNITTNSSNDTLGNRKKATEIANASASNGVLPSKSVKESILEEVNK